MAKDLRTYLGQLAREIPGQIVTVSEPITANLESCAVLQNLEDRGQYPVVVFRRPVAPCGQVSPFPLVANCCASRSYLALALDMRPTEFRHELTLQGTKRAQGRVPPLVVPADMAPVKQVVRTGEDADLRELPIPLHHSRDIAPFITSGAVVEKDPELGTYNVSMTRIQLNGARRTGMKVENVHHNGMIYEKYEKRGLATPAAIVIGHHPAFLVGCQWEGMGSVHGIDEYEIIGGMLAEPVRLVASETFGDELLVPADAEIVVEGRILPKVREPEGPMAEHTRYYKNILGDQVYPHHAPVFEVSAISHRRDALYMDSFVGHPDEQMLCAIPKEAKILQAALLAASGLRAVHLPPSGCGRYIGYMSLNQRVEGEARNAMLAAFGCDPHLKYCVAVDDDIDIFNEAEVLWAVALRTTPSDDCFVIPGARTIWLDPSTSMDGRRPVSAKMGIDATKPFGKPFSEVARFPEEVLARTRPEALVDPRPLLDFLDEEPGLFTGRSERKLVG